MYGAATGGPYQGNGTPGMPPYDPELERSVLGAPLLVPELTGQIVGTGLSPIHFFNRTHQQVYGATLGLHHRGDTVSLVTLRRALESSGTVRLDDLPVSSYLTGLMAATDDAYAAPAHAAHIIEDYQRRRLLDASRLLYRGAITGKPPKVVTARVMRAVQSIIELPERGRHTAPSPARDGGAGLFQRDVVAVQQFVDGMFPEGLTLLIGAPKIGKSMMLLSFTRAVPLGQPALGKLATLPSKVLYLCLEDGVNRTAHRWQTLVNQQATLGGLQAGLPSVTPEAGRPGADHGGFCPDDDAARFWFDCPPLDEGGRDELGRFLSEHAGPSGSDRRVMILVDTLTRIRPDESEAARSVSPYQRDYRFVTGLVDLIRPYACAMVCAHHDRKQPSSAGDFLDMASGTKGLTAAADNVVYLSRRLGETGLVMDVRGRDLEGGTHRVEWDAERFTWALVDDPQPVTPPGAQPLTLAQQRAMQIVYRLSKEGGPFSSAEFGERLGSRRGSASNMLGDLALLGFVQKIGHNRGTRWHPTAAGLSLFDLPEPDDGDGDDGDGDAVW